MGGQSSTWNLYHQTQVLLSATIIHHRLFELSVMKSAFRASGSSAVLGLVLMLFPLILVAQPAIQWQRCFGANSDDYFFSIVQTRDGGYAACGYSLSNDLPRHHAGANEDAYVVKMDANGNLEWQKCYGGTKNEEARQIIQTQDGGFAVAIRAESDDGDVPINYGWGDSWILKLSDTGAIEWSKDFGGLDEDAPESIIEEPDQSIVFAGANRSMTPETGQHHGGSVENDDGWVVKLNAPTGAANWQRYLGGSARDYFQFITQTRDGGFAVAGFTNSFDGDVTGYSRKDTFSNVWVCKLDGGGLIQWQKQYGGPTAISFANCIAQTTDGGYIVSCATYATEGEVHGNHGDRDGWVFKIDSLGTIEWQRCIGGSQTDGARFVVQDPDGGCTVAGVGNSTDGDMADSHGDFDGFVVKLDRASNVVWRKCLGGTGFDLLNWIIRTNDGGFAVAGYTTSNDGNVSGNHGGNDGWVVKFGPELGVVTGETLRMQELALTVTLDAVGRSANITYRTPSDHSDAVIEIANVLGIPLVHTHAINGDTGDQSMLLDISHLACGTYFVTLRASGVMQTRAIQIVR